MSTIELSEEKTFNLFLDRNCVNYKLWFSHCYDDKIYVFYSCYGLQQFYGDGNHVEQAYSPNDLCLLTICNKSFSILNGNPSIFLAFRYLIGAEALKRHGKRHFFRFDYAYWGFAPAVFNCKKVSSLSSY